MLRLMMVGLALLFGPFLFPTQNSAPPSPPPGKPYVDRDEYEVHAVLLKKHDKQFYVVQAKTKFKAGATTDSLTIKGGDDFKRVWGAAVEDYVKSFKNPVFWGMTSQSTFRTRFFPVKKYNRSQVTIATKPSMPASRRQADTAGSR